LSQDGPTVACFSIEIEEKTCFVAKTVVTLHRQSEIKHLSDEQKKKFIIKHLNNSINNLKLRKETNYGKDSSFNGN